MPLPRTCSAVAILAALAPLGACQSRSAPPAAVAAAPVVAPVLAAGPGCGPAIARTKAVVDSDVATGNLNEPVGARFNADLARAAAACAAGREGEGLQLLAAAKARYGYP